MEKNSGDPVRKRILDLQRNTDFCLTVFKGLAGYAVIAADFDGNVLAYNEGAGSMYGYGHDEIVGRKNMDIFFPADFLESGGLNGIIGKLIEKGSVSFETDKLRKGGQRFPAKCLFTLTKSNDGRMAGFVEITEDLTGFKRVEQELRTLGAELEKKVIERTAWLEDERRKAEASVQGFRVLLEFANDAVIGIKPPADIYLWNKKAEEMFGYSAAEAIGGAMHEIIMPERYRRKHTEALKTFFQAGKGKLIGKTIELEGQRKDGSVFPLELSLSAINVQGVWHSMAIIRDITERKRTEEGIRQNLDEVERMNRLMLGRELKIVDLKKEIVFLRARVKELEASLASR